MSRRTVSCAVLVSIGFARLAAAADGLGIKPLSCGDGVTYGVACHIGSLNGSQYRHHDARVDSIVRTQTYPGSGHQTISPADSQAVISSKVAALTAGNHLVLKNGTYTDLSLTVNKVGTYGLPITIRPESSGGVQLVGKTKISLRGEHIILADLKIRDGLYGSDGTVVRLGSSSGACNYCIAMKLRMTNLNGSSVFYVDARGKGVTIAYSTFEHFSSPGHFISASYPTEAGEPARMHIFRNRFYRRTFDSNVNGYELLQLGSSAVQGQSMYGRVEENLFEESAVPDQDTELITIKSSDWIFRNNTLRSNVGSLTLRSANRVLVEGNFFLGGSSVVPSASGIRVHGAGHWIVGNYFYKNANPAPVSAFSPGNAPYYYSVVVPAGQVEDVSDGEAGVPVAKNIVIANNTFAYGAYNVRLGSFYPYYQGLPRAVVFVNNLMRAERQSDPFEPTRNLPLLQLPSGSETEYLSDNPIENNLLSAVTSGLDGFQAPGLNWSNGLAWGHDGHVYRATVSSSSTDAADPLGAFPVVPVGTSFDLGAFQLEGPFRRPLAYAEVGALASHNYTNLLLRTEELDNPLWVRNRLRAFGGSGSVANAATTLAPDGSTGSELLREDSSFGTHSVEQTHAGDAAAVYTFSVYLKSGGAPAAMLYLSSPNAGDSGVALRVDLTTGAVSSAYSSGDAVFIARLVQPLGNGWYRVSLTGRPTSSGGVGVRAIIYWLQTAAGPSSYAGNGSSAVYVWGAQLENDSVATVLRSN